MSSFGPTGAEPTGRPYGPYWRTNRMRTVPLPQIRPKPPMCPYGPLRKPTANHFSGAIVLRQFANTPGNILRNGTVFPCALFDAQAHHRATFCVVFFLAPNCSAAQYSCRPRETWGRDLDRRPLMPPRALRSARPLRASTCRAGGDSRAHRLIRRLELTCEIDSAVVGASGYKFPTMLCGPCDVL